MRFGTATLFLLPSYVTHTDFHGGWQIIRDPDQSSAAARSPETIALEALGWILTDEGRADRLLSLTGLTPAALRDGLGDRAVLAAVLDFLSGHEADLVAAAIALDLPPQEISSAAGALAS